MRAGGLGATLGASQPLTFVPMDAAARAAAAARRVPSPPPPPPRDPARRPLRPVRFCEDEALVAVRLFNKARSHGQLLPD